MKSEDEVISTLYEVMFTLNDVISFKYGRGVIFADRSTKVQNVMILHGDILVGVDDKILCPVSDRNTANAIIYDLQLFSQSTALHTLRFIRGGNVTLSYFNLAVDSDESPSTCSPMKAPESLHAIITGFLDMARITYADELYERSMTASKMALTYSMRSKSKICIEFIPQCHKNMAECTLKLGKLSESISHWKLFLESGSMVSNMDRIHAMETLLFLYRKQRLYQEAVDTINDMFSLIPSTETLSLATTWSALASIKCILKDYDAAIKAEKCALDLHKLHSYPPDLEVAKCMRRLALYNIAKGECGPQTETLLVNAFNIINNNSNRDINNLNKELPINLTMAVNKESAAVMSVLSQLYLRRGRVSRAEELKCKEVQLRQNQLSPNGIELANAQWQHAAITRKRGDLELAGQLRLSAMNTLRQTSGPAASTLLEDYHGKHTVLCKMDNDAFGYLMCKATTVNT